MGDSKEIGHLLRLLRKYGVRRFKNADIEIVFGNSPTIEGSHTSSTPKPRASSKAENIAKEDLAKEEFETRREQLELMQIANPALYEQLVANGEIEDESDTAQH